MQKWKISDNTLQGYRKSNKTVQGYADKSKEFAPNISFENWSPSSLFVGRITEWTH